MTNLDILNTETSSKCGRVDGKCYKEDKTGYECQYCDQQFDPIALRYLCPNCKTKNTCCE